MNDSAMLVINRNTISESKYQISNPEEIIKGTDFSNVFGDIKLKIKGIGDLRYLYRAVISKGPKDNEGRHFTIYTEYEYNGCQYCGYEGCEECIEC
jgi:hypothetical protein